VVDAGSYVLNPSTVNGISMSSTGAITVLTTNAIAPTSLTTSVTSNGGAETHTSSAFSIFVKNPDCNPYISFPNL
jgi:hypothetical protein